MSYMQAFGAYREGRQAGEEQILAYYSAALDEVYRLRRALAAEARVTEAHLTLKSFPKSRRRFAESQVDRMRQAARGDAEAAYAGHESWVLDSAAKDAGMPQTLTRSQWEREIDARARPS